jgi:hypothetical protein
MWLLPVFWGFSAFGIIAAPSFPFLLGALVLTYLYIELYGAVLHVNLDNPHFLTLPILWESCLEFQVRILPFKLTACFTCKSCLLSTHHHGHASLTPYFPKPTNHQWHHFVPHEITVRSYSQIAADINLVVLLHFLAAHLTFLPRGGLADPHVRTVVCCGVANAYLLQFAHRQAHFRAGQRHPVAAVLQKWGLLVSEQMHRAHHRTFDTGASWAWRVFFGVVGLGFGGLCTRE